MKVSKFGKIEPSDDGVLHITGFTFVGGNNSDANDALMVIPAIINFLLSLNCSKNVTYGETFNHPSDLIVMKAIDKAREQSK